LTKDKLTDLLSQPLDDDIAEALVSLLVPISKLLVTKGFGARELIQAAKISYVYAAIAEVMPNQRKVNISRLAVTTGLTRKEIALVLSLKDAYRSPKKSKFRIMEQRAYRVMQGWLTDNSFKTRGGGPAELPLKSGRKSFAVLVEKYAGDVTPLAVLRELERIGAVRRTADNKLRLNRNSTKLRNRNTAQFSELARLMSDFSVAAHGAASANDSAVVDYRNFMVPSSNSAVLLQRTFARRAGALLAGIDQWIKVNSLEKEAAIGKVPVSLGIFYLKK
jgi:hypothetical protein